MKRGLSADFCCACVYHREQAPRSFLPSSSSGLFILSKLHIWGLYAVVKMSSVKICVVLSWLYCSKIFHIDTILFLYKYRHWLFLLQLFNVLGVLLFWFGLRFFLSFGPKVVLSVTGILSVHFLVRMCEHIMVQAKPAQNPQENQIAEH